MSEATVATQTGAAPAGILYITQPLVLLDDHPAHGGALAHARIIIHAEVVQVRGRYFLPGRTLEIIARRIEAYDGIIDVSGAQARSYELEKVDPSLNGTTESPDGKSGADGENGHDGGTLKVIVGEIAGDLSLVANGSRGGNSQRGGDGVRPKNGKPGNDGEFTKHEPPEGKYGAYVVRPKGSRWYWEMAHGEKGGDALNGGNAGTPGKPGNGGAGGNIELSYVVAPSRPPKLVANGAAAGSIGATAKAGPASSPGKGGRNRLYQYHWPGSTWEKFADDPDSDVKEIVSRFDLRHNAVSGQPGQPGTIPRTPPPGMDGASGTTKSIKATWDDLVFSIGIDLEFVRKIAEEDAASGNIPRALERYQWLADLTSERPNRSAHRSSLHVEATKRVEELRKQAHRS